jgi:AraC-like DNA-binding protein
MSVADVASASGFSSGSVFTRNFKQRYTMTPSEFRIKEN